MNNQIILDMCDYKEEKQYKTTFVVALVASVFLMLVSIPPFLVGVLTQDKDLIFAICIFPFGLAILLQMLFIRNNRLVIYRNHLTKYNLFGRKKEYDFRASTTTINVKRSLLWTNGFQLEFQNSEGKTFCKYLFNDNARLAPAFNEKRSTYGEGLAKSECKIVDKGHFLIAAYAEEPEATMADDCEYVRMVIKRNVWLIPLGLSPVFIAANVLLFVLTKEVLAPKIKLFIYILMVIQPIGLVFAMYSRYSRLSKLDNETLIQTDIAKNILSNRKKH